MRKQFTATIKEIFSKDKKTIMLLGDIGVYSFRDLFKKYPKRFYNIGILEQSMISMAAGLSNVGFNPIVHTIAPFIVNRAFEQLKIDRRLFHNSTVLEVGPGTGALTHSILKKKPKYFTVIEKDQRLVNILNEKYGEIERVKFVANTLGLGVYDFVPYDPSIKENPPYIGFSLLDLNLAPKIDCFVFDSKGKVESETFKFNERIEIRLKRKLTNGRSRLNCTAKDNKGNWRWFGHQFYL